MTRLTTEKFRELMLRLAAAWEGLETEVALNCFTEDAYYSEPPDIQVYVGHEQLRPYIAALRAGTLMRFENLWFDEESQTGAGEYTFGSKTNEVADHGVAVVELHEGRIAVWHEYQRKGPTDFAQFVAAGDKDWQWHIGNYP